MSFKLLEKIDISDGASTRRIGLYEGDLSAIPPEHWTDILVVSAFPDDYSPTPTSLIGALHRSGLSVEGMAKNKLYDLRDTCAFWISAPLTGAAAKANIGQIACFESQVLGSPPTVVGDLFRGLFPFLDDRKNQVVTMPLLAAGDQCWPAEAMLYSILDAASHWLSRGLGISELKIVAHRPHRRKTLLETMAEFRARLYVSPVKPPRCLTYDVFLSFSSADARAADAAKAALQHRPNIQSVFDFRLEMDKGRSWQEEIDRAMSSCKAVVALLSPTYFASPECREELMQARLRHKRSVEPILFPVYWRDWGQELHLWLQVLNYADCRESDYQSLSSTMGKLSFA